MLFFLLVIQFNVILERISIIEYLFFHSFLVKNSYHEMVELFVKLNFMKDIIFFLMSISEAILLISLIKTNKIMFNHSLFNFKK